MGHGLGYQAYYTNINITLGKIQDLLATCGITKLNAPTDEVEKAFKELLVKFHPDKFMASHKDAPDQAAVKKYADEMIKTIICARKAYQER